MAAVLRLRLRGAWDRHEFFLHLEIFQTEVVEKLKTHFMFSMFFFPENGAVYEVMWKNIVELDRPQMII